MSSKNGASEPAQNQNLLRANSLNQQQIRPEPIDVEAHPVLNAVQNEIIDRRHSADDFNLLPVANLGLKDLDDPREENKNGGEGENGSENDNKSPR